MDDGVATSERPKRRRGFSPRPLTWLAWIAIAALCSTGLLHYRIDNDLSSWTPDLDTKNAADSYAVIGFDRDAFDDTEIAASLRALSSVSVCVDSASLKQFGRLQGITPENFVISSDGTYRGIFVFRQVEYTDDAFVRQIHGALRTYDRDLDRFALAGPAVFHVALNTYSQQRLPAILLLINLLGGFWLWWITANARVAATGVIAIVLSQTVLAGVASWCRIPFDLSLSMVPPLIMAVGYSYAAHRALRRGTGDTLLLCSATTAVGIASVGLSDLAPLRMFAVCGALGTVLVWLAVVTLVPVPAVNGCGSRPPSRLLEPLLRGSLSLIKRSRKAIVLTAALVTVASIFAVPHLRVEKNPLRFFPPDARIRRDVSTLNNRLTGTLPFQVSVIGSADPTDMLQGTTGVRKVINVTSFVGGNGSTYWGLASQDALPDLIAAQDSWQVWARSHRVQLTWGGVAAQINAIGVRLRRVASVTFPVMGMIAALAVWLVTGNPSRGLMAAWVNLLPVGGLVLIAAVFELSIGLPSLMIGAIAIGMAIDDTVHLTRAFERRQSVVRGVVCCWRACVGSTLVTASCLVLFAISSFRPTRAFGLLLAAAALIALVVDMVLLPVLCTPKRNVV